MFRLSALPASFGDCLWIEYGDGDHPNVILVDAGPSLSQALISKLKALASRGGHLELVVVTHVDKDHIGGMLMLLEKDFYGVKVRDFWFNGFRHLSELEAFGEKQGERLTALLLTKGVAWNAVVDNAGLLVTPETCPTFVLPGGAKITLLSPDRPQLERLKASWIKVCGEADLYADVAAVTEYFGVEGMEAFGAAGVLDVPTLAAQTFEEDYAEANGSSIAFILEYDGRRLLLGADAYPSRLTKSLSQVLGDPPYRFDLVKVPHHGSERNLSKAFVEAIDCERYLFSSNGAYFQHPSQPAVARVVHYGKEPELIFNYRTSFSEIWDNAALKSLYKYTTVYGDGDGASVDI